MTGKCQTCGCDCELGKKNDDVEQYVKEEEQYKILSPKKGILLAEKNYLPVDKRGNVNVLIVGRFWFW